MYCSVGTAEHSITVVVILCLLGSVWRLFLLETLLTVMQLIFLSEPLFCFFAFYIVVVFLSTYSQFSTTIPAFGTTKKPSTLQEERLSLT